MSKSPPPRPHINATLKSREIPSPSPLPQPTKPDREAERIARDDEFRKWLKWKATTP